MPMNYFAEKIVRFFLVMFALGCAAPAAARSPEPTLEIMTFNVRLPLTQDGPNAWEHRRDLAAQMIAAERPDIVATQELFKVQGDYLLARLPGYAWFGLDRKGGHGDEHMGIFYRRDRLRLLELGNFWLSDTPRIPGSITWGHPYPRMVTWGLFQTSAGRRFYVANTHFPYREQDGEARRKGAAQILAWIGTLPPEVPVVLAGDFNTEPGSEPHALLTTQLGDAWLGAAERAGPEATFHAFTGKGARRIDWILARGLRAQRIRTLTINRRGLYPSDHHPVIADLKWVSGR
jgi:endonuclease/exonuclease/phosphatase family metal-dependent hydrolase